MTNLGIKSENKIANIKHQTDDKKGVLFGFEWNDVPELAVICGKNGAGKTKLLEHLANNQSINTELLTITYSDGTIAAKGGQNNSRTNVHFIPANYRFEKYFDSVQDALRDGVYRNLEHQRKNIDETVEQSNAEVFKQVAKKHGKTFANCSPEEQIGFFSEIYITLNNDLENNYLAKTFLLYLECEKHMKLSLYDKGIMLNQEELRGKFPLPPPWEVLNTTLAKYGFKYQIEPLEDYNLYSYSPVFIHNDDKNTKINHQDLSYGEKTILMLILWAYNNHIANTNKLFLLDEIDAHLNPELIETCLKIIREVLVETFNAQVIMTTHSPSTVAYTKEGELFWMERQNEVFLIEKANKNDIIPRLTNGIMTFKEASNILRLIEPDDEIIVLLEGKIDVKHFELAKENLGIRQKIKFLSCDCADKLKQFIISCPDELFLHPNKTIKMLAIFDNDIEGNKRIRQCKKSNFDNTYPETIYRLNCSENKFATMLYVPKSNSEFEYKATKEIIKNFPIEYAYEKTIIDEAIANEDFAIVKLKAQDINSKLLKNGHTVGDSELANDSEFDKLCYHKPSDTFKIKFIDYLNHRSENICFKYYQPIFDLIIGLIG